MAHMVSECGGWDKRKGARCVLTHVCLCEAGEESFPKGTAGLSWAFRSEIAPVTFLCKCKLEP